MPAALTLHTMEPALSARLASYARREKKSLYQTAKELLSSALGLTAPRKTDHSDDLARFIGAWDDETADRIRKNLETFSTIDEARWK